MGLSGLCLGEYFLVYQIKFLFLYLLNFSYASFTTLPYIICTGFSPCFIFQHMKKVLSSYIYTPHNLYQLQYMLWIFSICSTNSVSSSVINSSFLDHQDDQENWNEHNNFKLRPLSPTQDHLERYSVLKSFQIVQKLKNQNHIWHWNCSHILILFI